MEAHIKVWNCEPIITYDSEGPPATSTHLHELEEDPPKARACAEVMHYELPFGPLGAITHSLFVTNLCSALFQVPSEDES